MILNKSRPILRYIAFTLLLSLTLIMSMVNGASAMAVDRISLKIGYYGWSPDQYVEKRVFTDAELREMPTVECVYSYFDGTSRVAIDSARGVYLSTILAAAGIDQGSISAISFYTADSGSGAYITKTMQQLLLSDRYYFNDLAAYLSYDEYGDVVADDEVWNMAQNVSTMLAYEESWVWYNVGTSGSGPTWSNLSTQKRYRLNFGQQEPLEMQTFASAEMVHTMYIMFSGTPVLTASETNIGGKVGSKHKLKITAGAVDEALEGQIQGNITFYSTDESVATVDDDGTVHYVGKGHATIVAESGGARTEISVSVGGKGDGGDGDGKGGGADKSKNPESSSQAKTDKKIRVYALSDEASKNLKLALNKQAPAEMASMSTYQEEMDEDSEQLKLKKKNQHFMLIVGAISLIIAVGGALYGTKSFDRALVTNERRSSLILGKCKNKVTKAINRIKSKMTRQ